MLILKQVYVVRLMYKASTWTKRRQIGVFVGRRRLVTDDNVFFLKEEKRERVLLSSLKALEKCVWATDGIPLQGKVVENSK